MAQNKGKQLTQNKGEYKFKHLQKTSSQLLQTKGKPSQSKYKGQFVQNKSSHLLQTKGKSSQSKSKGKLSKSDEKAFYWSRPLRYGGMACNGEWWFEWKLSWGGKW